jgi:hypothetical protein
MSSMPSVVYAVSVVNKPFMLSVSILNAVMLSVIMLIVVAPQFYTMHFRPYLPSLLLLVFLKKLSAPTAFGHSIVAADI